MYRGSGAEQFRSEPMRRIKTSPVRSVDFSKRISIFVSLFAGPIDSRPAPFIYQSITFASILLAVLHRTFHRARFVDFVSR